ncbi:MAG: hypothetical protein ABIZ81_09470 [Opitutaceae bacterium]
MHLVGLLRLLGDPRYERFRSEPLGGLRGRAGDLAHNDVLTPMHIDTSLISR